MAKKCLQLLQLSAAATTFRNYFVKLYATGTYKENEPHGQVRNDVDMVRVLLVQENSSKEVVSKASTWKSTMEFHVGRTLFRVT